MRPQIRSLLRNYSFLLNKHSNNGIKQAEVLNRFIYPSYQGIRMMSSSERSNDPLNLTTDKSNYEATAGTMKDVKLKIIEKMGLQFGYNPLQHTREHLVQYTPKSIDELPPRSMQDSFTSAIIPLSTDVKLREKYVGFLGSLRVGRLMEDMDLFAVWVVHQHVLVPNLEPGIPLPYTFVTILVDKIDFTEIDGKPDADIRLSGHVSWVGKSSVEVVVWLEQRRTGKWRKITRALFLMAARDPCNIKAAVVNPLVPGNDEEKRILEGGESRKKRRQAIQQFDLLKTEPNAYETKLIHDLFIKTIDTKSKAFNKRILPPGCIWMEDADLNNIIFSHPEDRNNHNKIFGGFLMRHALELSWALGYSFSKRRPKLEHISDINFIKPVDVSSLISMSAHVLYTELNYMEIVVIAEVFDPVSGSQSTTNSFYFTYSVADTLPQVIPKTYHEAIWYIDGRRKFRHIMDSAATP
ncbi:acyl-coenzyme A thioesterase 9, mitochondrial-like [Chironomus tepperi]|uniref:acyl-coenzyme A thioesterase 9, mitochondrial-like n=1 Tax=Chironomus tepperi TaxID=113505 RepID=UPI00391F1E81